MEQHFKARQCEQPVHLFFWHSDVCGVRVLVLFVPADQKASAVSAKSGEVTESDQVRVFVQKES